MTKQITNEEIEDLLKQPRTKNCGWFRHKEEYLGEARSSYHNIYKCINCGRITMQPQGPGCDY